MNILHDSIERKFYTFIDDKEYFLEYNVVNDDLWEFTCNYISRIITNLKEINVRESIIEHALNYMKNNNIKLFESGSCFDVRDFIDRKKEIDYLLNYVIK
ncbi:hypothetical protein MYP_2917 [Sporocytophaga myxococcoides]|uniref:Uncharacterized protein n=1 Tax=Sporocytophaga myxococcoides TaxID=153721 RepID=A0A098LHT1_9BACT|nr:hypothetical protein [Sporocytophaga myxococcoides]GAL85688.1 hypothetical protein MYP_2917 [Sporocytophaga myxococcoides]